MQIPHPVAPLNQPSLVMLGIDPELQRRVDDLQSHDSSLPRHELDTQ
jgi:hypothetical protein